MGYHKAIDIGEIATQTANEVWSYLCKVTNVVKSSNNERIVSNTEKCRGGSTYMKIKEIKVYVRGKIKVKFEAKANNPSHENYLIKIYKNGVDLGDTYTANTTTYQEFSKNNIDVDVGDLIQLYGKGSGDGAYGGCIRKFAICYDSDNTGGVITLE